MTLPHCECPCVQDGPLDKKIAPKSFRGDLCIYAMSNYFNCWTFISLASVTPSARLDAVPMA